MSSSILCYLCIFGVIFVCLELSFPPCRLSQMCGDARRVLCTQKRGNKTRIEALCGGSRACQLASPVFSNHTGETVNARVQRPWLGGFPVSLEKNLLIVGLRIDHHRKGERKEKGSWLPCRPRFQSEGTLPPARDPLSLSLSPLFGCWMFLDKFAASTHITLGKQTNKNNHLSGSQLISNLLVIIEECHGPLPYSPPEKRICAF